MTSKLVPRNPSEVMVIRDVTPNIVTCSAPFSRFGRVKIGGRGTLVRLPTGGVAVFSPTALTPEVEQKVAELGDVKYIAALDFEHHIFLGPWHEKYPQAKVLGVEGLREKRIKQKNEDVPFAVEFSEKNKEATKVDPEFDSAFDYEYVGGHTNHELVFNFKPERTLIEGDLIFNLPATEQYSKSKENATSGIFTRLFQHIGSATGPALGQRRLIWYATSSGNRPSFNTSMVRIHKWDFDRIIPCHGDVIETGGKGVFEKVLQWHLAAQK